MGKKSKVERDNVWDNISTANFELGLKIWNQYLEKDPASLNHKLSNSLIKEMGSKWEAQSVEARNKLYSNLDKKGTWKKLPDIKYNLRIKLFVIFDVFKDLMLFWGSHWRTGLKIGKV